MSRPGSVVTVVTVSDIRRCDCAAVVTIQNGIDLSLRGLHWFLLRKFGRKSWKHGCCQYICIKHGAYIYMYTYTYATQQQHILLPVQQDRKFNSFSTSLS